MRVVLPKQKRRQAAQKRALDLRFRLKTFSPLLPILRWAQAKFTRRPSWRAFVSWQAYYSVYLSPDASTALIRHSGPYVGSSNQQIELINAMVAGRGPAMVWAPPGCGKSRFALELARRIEREHPRWHVVFVRHDERIVREELPQLMQLKRVIFIVDDSHECPELVKLLADACGQSPATASLHLLCLTRPTDRARVTRAIDSAFAPGAIHGIDLGRPSPDVVRTLIDQLLPQSSPHHRETIARFVRQSYFGAVLGCNALSRQARLPQTFQRHDLRDRICRDSLRATTDGVCPIESALRALAVYAALAPVAKARAEVHEWAVQLSGLAPATVDALTDRVLKADLFQQDDRGLMRPIPDLLGDLILELACLDPNGKPAPFSTQLLEQLLEAEPVATVRNCAGIGLLFGTAQDVDLISRLVLERAEAIPAGNQWEVLKLLQSTQPLAAQRPVTVLELARVMEARGILRRNPPAAELLGTNSVEMATCALLMSAGEVDSTAVPVALGRGRDLFAASGDHARSRERVLDELKAYCRFETGRTIAHAQAVVDTLRDWISEPAIEAAALSASLSAQFLPLEVEGQSSEENATGSLRSPLIPVPEVWAVRDVAIDTLSRGMAHSDATVQCVAIGSLENYAEYQGTPDQTWLDRWQPQLQREMERLSTAVIRLAKETAALRVSAAAELQGWRWWAHPQDVLHRAGEAILRAIPDTDAYRLWKLLYALPLPMHTALPDPAPMQPQDRLQYVPALSAARDEDAIERARHLFDTLDSRYPDISAWRGLWLIVLEQAPQTPIHQHAGVVIGEFARRHPEVAWSFVNQADAEGPLFVMLPFLLAELGKRDRARRSTEARSVPPGTRLEEAWLRALSFTSDFDEPERAILARGLESTDSDAVHRAADALLAAHAGDRSTAFRKVFGVIARRPTDSELWDLAIQRFVSWAEVVLPPRSDEPADGMAQIAGELITLLQTQGSHLRWGFQRHTRRLADALAISAVLCPRRLQAWMQRDWSQSEASGGGWSDASPLTVGRLPEIMRLVADSPAAAQWIEILLEWMRYHPRLPAVAALGLAELCSLDDPRIVDLSKAIGPNPTGESQKALAEFVNLRKRRERPGSGVSTTD